MKVSGIYKIINKTNGKYYVGSTIDFRCRWNEHKKLLKKNAHHNLHLQSAWNFYGEKNFEFSVVEKTSKENLLDTEQRYLNECKQNPDTNYNISYDAYCPTRGMKFGPRNEETKRKIQQTLTGQKHSKERVEKIKAARTGKCLGKDNPFYGKTHPPELLKQIGEKISKGKVWFYHPIHGAVNKTRREMIREYQCNDSHICRVAIGKEKTYKGWVLDNSQH